MTINPPGLGNLEERGIRYDDQPLPEIKKEEASRAATPLARAYSPAPVPQPPGSLASTMHPTAGGTGGGGGNPGPGSAMPTHGFHPPPQPLLGPAQASAQHLSARPATPQVILACVVLCLWPCKSLCLPLPVWHVPQLTRHHSLGLGRRPSQACPVPCTPRHWAWGSSLSPPLSCCCRCSLLSFLHSMLVHSLSITQLPY